MKHNGNNGKIYISQSYTYVIKRKLCVYFVCSIACRCFSKNERSGFVFWHYSFQTKLMANTHSCLTSVRAVVWILLKYPSSRLRRHSSSLFMWITILSVLIITHLNKKYYKHSVIGHMILRKSVETTKQHLHKTIVECFTTFIVSHIFPLIVTVKDVRY